MTTGTNPDVNPGARRWAAGLLGVPETASAVEARRAYFRKLQENDFLAPRSLHSALRVLDGKPPTADLDEEWLLEEEGRLGAEVESFAEQFFTLPAIQRRQCWEALLSRVQSVSPLTARLQALKAGLEVEIQSLPLGDTFHGQLARQLLQSFPLPPLGQATSRQAFLRQIEASSAAADHRSWEKAARYLLAEWPGLTGLDQELVQDVAKLRSRLKHQSKRHQRSQRQRRAAAHAGGGKGNHWWLFLLLPGALSGIFRGMTTSNNSSSSRAPSSSYSAPRDWRDLTRLENQHLRELTDPKTGAKSFHVFPNNLPPLHELFDPSKFEVEAVNPTGLRILRFTPRRSGPPVARSNGSQANKDQPVLIGEATLTLLGVSKETINGLFSRAAVGKHPDSTPKPPPAEVGPKNPKSPQGDKKRP